MNYTIQKHLAYNLWANGKFVEILKNIDENIFEKEVMSSFPTLKKTVCHIWDAEAVWLSRINGVSPKDWPSKSFTGDKIECLQRFINNSAEFTEFFQDLNDSYTDKRINFNTMNGEKASETIEGIIFHVVNHGTFRRGQLVTMLRTLRVSHIPATDLIRYLRQF